MKTRFFLSLLALLFASGILAVSLAGASTAIGSTGQSSSQKRLYFGKEILPDHILYPAFRVADRLQLETASSSERVFIQMDFANKRLEASESLLDIKKEELAVETLYKAQSYLENAVTEANQLNTGESVRHRLEKTVEYHNGKLTQLKDHCNDANRAEVDTLIERNRALLQKI